MDMVRNNFTSCTKHANGLFGDLNYNSYREYVSNIFVSSILTPGVLRYGLDVIVPIKPQNYLFLRVNLKENGAHFGGFFSIYRPILNYFLVYIWQTPHIFLNFGKMDPCLGIIL